MAEIRVGSEVFRRSGLTRRDRGRWEKMVIDGETAQSWLVEL